MKELQISDQKDRVLAGRGGEVFGLSDLEGGMQRRLLSSVMLSRRCCVCTGMCKVIQPDPSTRTTY